MRFIFDLVRVYIEFVLCICLFLLLLKLHILTKFYLIYICIIYVLYFLKSMAQTSGYFVCKNVVNFWAFCACWGEQLRQLRTITSGRAAERKLIKSNISIELNCMERIIFTSIIQYNKLFKIHKAKINI